VIAETAIWRYHSLKPAIYRRAAVPQKQPTGKLDEGEFVIELAVYRKSRHFSEASGELSAFLFLDVTGKNQEIVR
jgi:hypothetical protein